MTSFAFILGVVPLVVATGAGYEMRRALGTAVFSGMIGVTFFGIFFTPVFYVSIRWINRKFRPNAGVPGKHHYYQDNGSVPFANKANSAEASPIHP